LEVEFSAVFFLVLGFWASDIACEQFRINKLVLFRIPKIAGKDLDLHLLYIEVTSRGGLQQVLFSPHPHQY
jgi:hypothetical protein